MTDGDKVVVTGSIEVYEAGGRYQLYARKIERFGEGELFLRFEKLKKELSEEGKDYSTLLVTSCAARFLALPILLWQSWF